MRKNIFGLFIDKILNVPFWVKQVLYLKLTKEMQDKFCEDFLRENSENIFSTFVPILTFKGQTELSEKKCGFDNNIYNFLEACANGQSLLEISVNTFLSMEETAKYFEFCVEQNFLDQPGTKEIKAIAGFISGKYRIGEYFEQNGKINPDQLQNAIQTYEKNSSGENAKNFGQILIDLGYIKKEELIAILILKEEAQKRFIIDYNTVPQIKTVYSNENEQFKQEIKTLTEENKKLKKKMQHLLELVRKNAE